MFGVAIALIFIALSLGIGWKHGSLNLGQMIYGMFLGLLLASLSPDMAHSANQFITSIGKDIQNIHWN